MMEVASREKKRADEIGFVPRYTRRVLLRQGSAQRQFETAIDWGRYAKLFEYDADEEIIQLPEE